MSASYEISRLALHEQVAINLRSMLVEGHIAPGAKLNERALSEQLGVSRTPLREAIRQLAAEGLVDLLPNRGAAAVKLTEADVQNTFEVLAMLEGMAGELATQRMTDEELAELCALHFEMQACYARKDLFGYYTLNMRIHMAISEAAKNPLLSATYSRINARVLSLRFKSNHDETKWKSSLKEHEQLMEALKARDSHAVRTLLTEHLMHKRDSLLESMRSARPATFSS